MFLSKLLGLFRPNHRESQQATHSIPTITFDSSRVTASVKADIRSTLKAAGDIPKAKLPGINKTAVASVEKGRDLGTLHRAIMSSSIDGMTERRSAEIASHVHNRATSIMATQQQVDSGIQEAVWMYSGAPCYPNTRSPSPEQVALDAAHKAADGQRYRVGEGLHIAGQRVWPGREMGCKCLSRPVVKGFS